MRNSLQQKILEPQGLSVRVHIVFALLACDGKCAHLLRCKERLDGMEDETAQSSHSLESLETVLGSQPHFIFFQFRFCQVFWVFFSLQLLKVVFGGPPGFRCMIIWVSVCERVCERECGCLSFQSANASVSLTSNNDSTRTFFFFFLHAFQCTPLRCIFASSVMMCGWCDLESCEFLYCN